MSCVYVMVLSKLVHSNSGIISEIHNMLLTPALLCHNVSLWHKGAFKRFFLCMKPPLIGLFRAWKQPNIGLFCAWKPPNKGILCLLVCSTNESTVSPEIWTNESGPVWWQCWVVTDHRQARPSVYFSWPALTGGKA